jgi:dihydroorotase
MEADETQRQKAYETQRQKADGIQREEADETIDVNGKYVMPGFLDLHVHLREPGFEDKETVETGTKAAAHGGFTGICPMPNTKPATDSPERIAWLLKKAEEVSPVHVYPVGAVTLGQNGTELADIEGMVKAGAKALSEDGKSVMNTLLYKEALKKAAECSIPMLAHCEDKELVNGGVMNAGKKAEELGLPGISNAVEDVIAARDILLAKETGAQLHLCHCSTKDSVALVKLGKQLGARVTAEVCPHHFSMSEEDILCDDGNYKMNPPLRKKEDVEALKLGLKDGIMEAISTDHAPHEAEKKKESMRTAPFGIVGLETAFALAVTELVEPGYLTKMQLVERMSLSPARILHVEAGTLSEGMPADLVVADFEEEYVIDPEEFVSKGKNTPFAGKKVKGRVLLTMVDGKTVYEFVR